MASSSKSPEGGATRTPPAASQFGLGTATALIVGSIIGVGVFNLPTSLAGYGPISLVSLALTTVGALALAVLFASLSRRLPADGGPYAYARSAFGNGLGSGPGDAGLTVPEPFTRCDRVPERARHDERSQGPRRHRR